MRKYILLLSVLYVIPTFSQNSPKIRENVPPTYNLKQNPNSFEDYLVQLAWQNSGHLESYKYESEARKQEIDLAKKDWTRFLQAGLNLNDVSLPSYLYYNMDVKKFLGNDINPNRFTQIATYPIWNIGLGVSFGDLIMRKNKVKYAENRKKVVDSDMNAEKQKIKGEILKRYQEFLMVQEVLKVRIQALDAAQANKSQMENMFAVNKISFSDLTQANKAYFDALEAKVQFDSEVKIRKIAMEELLGIKWEKVEIMKGNFDNH
jgi:outer membrane protein TolC